jgi:holliday junction DNA helicase RuvA
MIGRLTGTLVEHEGTVGIVDVSGVGYEVHATRRCFHGWADSEEPAVVHVVTQVREDEITLYGFSDRGDRTAFGELTKVKGVGPKLALAALELFTVGELGDAVESDNTTALARIPGVGKRTAQRLALELKGKLATAGGQASALTPARSKTSRAEDPLRLALARLDFGRSEIDALLMVLVGHDLGPEKPLQDRLRAALRASSGQL